MALRKLVDSIRKPVEVLDREQLAAFCEGLDVTPLDELPLRVPIKIAGEISVRDIRDNCTEELGLFGATIGADAAHLVDLAIMGSAMARIFFDIDRPTVGLLNVGVEEIKGLDQIREAASVLREAPLPIRYHGFVEGDDVGQGGVGHGQHDDVARPGASA